MRTLKFNISASSLNNYRNSQLIFYYNYIIKAEPDTKTIDVYGDGGNCVHEILDEYVTNPDSVYDVDMLFTQKWVKKDLDTKPGIGGKHLDKQKYVYAAKLGIMKINNIYSKLGLLTSEEKYLLPLRDGINLKGYVDLKIKDKDDIILVDWKTSSSADDEDENFLTQGKMYFLLHYLKYGILPKKIIFDYLKIGKEKSLSFSLNEILEFKKEVERVVDEIIKKNDNINLYSLGDIDNMFNKHKQKCLQEKYRRSKNKEIKIKIKNNKLWFENVEDLDKNIFKLLDEKYSYMVSGYQWSEKYKKRIWDGKKHFWKRNTLPSGFINSIKRFFNDYNKHYNSNYILVFEDERNKEIMEYKNTTKFKQSEKKLYPYQEDSVKIILEKEVGIINLATGLGKTLVSMELVRRLNGNVLFVVNRLELAEQTKEKYEDELGVEIGLITEGNLDTSHQITVASIQSIHSILKNRKEDKEQLKKFLLNINICIWDECHNVSDASDYYKMIRGLLFNCKYMIGLTATPYRNDSTTLDMNSVVGFPEVVYDTKYGEEKCYLCKTKTFFIKNKIPNSLCVSYPEVYNEVIVNNNKRNNIVKKICEKLKGNKILILTKIIEHAYILQKLIPGSEVVNSSVVMKDRKIIMKEFKKSSSGVVIAGIKIAGQGLDLPDLDAVINVSAHKSIIDSVQIIGRVKRNHEGKRFGYFFDFYDNNMFFKATIERISALKKQGNEVKIVDLEEIEW